LDLTQNTNYQISDGPTKAGWQQPIIPRNFKSKLNLNASDLMIDAETPKTRELLTQMNTPLFNLNGINFRINDKFVKDNKKGKKSKYLKNEHKSVEGAESEVIKGNREYTR